MATSDSIHLAQAVIETINNAKQGMRAHAGSYQKQLAVVDAIVNDPAKLAILLDGLDGLKVDGTALRAEKDTLQAANQHILDKVPVLTR